MPFAQPQHDSISASTGQPSDEQLMLAYAGGDVQAFRHLYGQHKDPLWRFFLRRGMDAECAEELVQEVWQRVITSAHHYQPSARFTTWLYQIARNLLADQHRKAHRRFTLVGTEPDALEEPSQAYPHSLTEQARLASRLKHCLGKLPALQLDVFLLKEEAGLSMEQVAKIMSCGVEACKSRWRYAVASLSKCIGLGEQDHD